MENGTEKVCRRCGTLNDARSLMCVRCGSELDETGEQKYDILKERMVSGTLIVFLFIVLFAAYSYGMIFYVAPWFESKLVLFGNTFIFEYYNNPNITYIILESIYTICMFLVNWLVVVLILEIIIGSKLLKRSTIALTKIFIYLFMLLIVGGMTIYKYGLDYVTIIEHFASIIVVFPYIKKKIFKRSV